MRYIWKLKSTRFPPGVFLTQNSLYLCICVVGKQASGLSFIKENPLSENITTILLFIAKTELIQCCESRLVVIECLSTNGDSRANNYWFGRPPVSEVDLNINKVCFVEGVGENQGQVPKRRKYIFHNKNLMSFPTKISSDPDYRIHRKRSTWWTFYGKNTKTICRSGSRSNLRFAKPRDVKT